MSGSSLALAVVVDASIPRASEGTARAAAPRDLVDQGQGEVPQSFPPSAQPKNEQQHLRGEHNYGLLPPHAEEASIAPLQEADPPCEVVHFTSPLAKTVDDHCPPLPDDEELLDYGDGDEDESLQQQHEVVWVVPAVKIVDIVPPDQTA